MPNRMVLAKGKSFGEIADRRRLLRREDRRASPPAAAAASSGADRCGPSAKRAASPQWPVPHRRQRMGSCHLLWHIRRLSRKPVAGDRQPAPESPGSPIRPGWASPSRRSPPCSVATAEARLNPRPEPGWVRLASSRTNRSTACLRSASGNAGPMVGDAEQHLIAVAPRLDQDRILVACRMPTAPAPSGCADGTGLPYLIAFSTRLASAWLINSRLP